MMEESTIGSVGSLGCRNKFIKHRTSASGQLTFGPTASRCQVCPTVSLVTGETRAQPARGSPRPTFSAKPPRREFAFPSAFRMSHCLRTIGENGETPGRDRLSPHLAIDTLTRTSTRRLAAASAVGTTLEWYDFAVYNTLAALTFNRVFFPSFDPMT